MTIFKRAGKRSKKGTEYNFMLVCIKDFSNFFMIELIKNKRAATVLNAVIKIIQRVKSMPVFIYCDKGSEFDNKLFTDQSTNGFRVQFTIDRRKAVYAERAIRTIRRGLEQYFTIRPFDNDIKSAVKTIVNGHSHSPSRRNPVVPMVRTLPPSRWYVLYPLRSHYDTFSHGQTGRCLAHSSIATIHHESKKEDHQQATQIQGGQLGALLVA